MNRRNAIRVAGTLLAALILYRIYRSLAPQLAQLTWAQVTVWHPAVWPLLLSFVVLTSAQLLHAWLWRRIAVDLGSPAPNMRDTLHIFFVSSLGRYVPGKVWQIAGLAALAGRFGMAAGRAAAASVIAQLVFLSTGLLALGASMPQLRAVAGNGAGYGRLNPTLFGVAIIMATMLGTWLVAATRVGGAFRTALVRLAGPEMGGRLGNSVAIAEAMSPRHALVWAAGYGLSWVLLGVAFWLFVTAFHPVDSGLAFYTGAVFVASYLGGYIALGIPAGLGVREAVTLTLLSLVVPVPAAVMISACARLWSTAAELFPLALIPLAGKSSTETVTGKVH